MWFFVKLFEKECYANHFINGRIFINRLSHFKKDEKDTNRYDTLEGANYISPTELYINGKDIVGDLNGPIIVKMDFLNFMHIFCLYTGHTNDFGDLVPEKFEDAARYLKLSDDCRKFGSHPVLITNGKEFIRRVKNAAESKGYRIVKGLVKYYDPMTVKGSFGDLYNIRALFMKRNKYSYQREYRFVIDTNVIDDKHIILDIGDIRDITKRCSVDVINDTLRFQQSQRPPE